MGKIFQSSPPHFCSLLQLTTNCDFWQDTRNSQMTLPHLSSREEAAEFCIFLFLQKLFCLAKPTSSPPFETHIITDFIHWYETGYLSKNCQSWIVCIIQKNTLCWQTHQKWGEGIRYGRPIRVYCNLWLNVLEINSQFLARLGCHAFKGHFGQFIDIVVFSRSNRTGIQSPFLLSIKLDRSNVKSCLLRFVKTT